MLSLVLSFGCGGKQTATTPETVPTSTSVQQANKAGATSAEGTPQRWSYFFGKDKVPTYADVIRRTSTDIYSRWGEPKLDISGTVWTYQHDSIEDGTEIVMLGVGLQGQSRRIWNMFWYPLPGRLTIQELIDLGLIPDHAPKEDMGIAVAAVVKGVNCLVLTYLSCKRDFAHQNPQMTGVFCEVPDQCFSRKFDPEASGHYVVVNNWRKLEVTGYSLAIGADQLVSQRFNELFGGRMRVELVD
jgi:hypothetical protein